MEKEKTTSEWVFRVKRLINEKGITQEELAERVGLSQSAISHWFSGFREPSLNTLSKLADILGVSLAFLLFGEENNWPFSTPKSEFDILPQYAKDEINNFISYQLFQHLK